MNLRRPRIFTLGHSNRSLDEFVRILEASSIILVADIRSNPASVRFPHFERNALSKELTKRGISYRWFRSLGLGGRAPASPFEDEHTALYSQDFRRYAALMNTEEFKRVFKELVGLSASTVAAVLCSEWDVEHCHRRLLSDKLHIEGVRVIHILNEVESKEHSLHPDIEVRNDKMIYRARQLSFFR